MRKSVREKQRELREDLILDAAYELLLEHGYKKMNMDDLATQVGIAKMTLYQHFPSKEALAIGVIVRGMKLVEEELTLDPTSSHTAFERLKELLRKSIARRSAIRRIHIDLVPATVLQHPAFQLQRARLAVQWEQLIEDAKAEGTIDPSLSTPVLIRTIFQMFQTDYDDLLHEGVINLEELTSTLLSFTLKGMQKSSKEV